MPQWTTGGMARHPYGQMQEHLDRLRIALQATDLPTETVDSLQNRIEEIELSARPEDFSYCGAPEAEIEDQIARGLADGSEDFTPTLERIGKSILTAILEESVRDLNAACGAGNFQEACAISYCLGRLEGTLGKITFKDMAEELIEHSNARRSQGGKNSARLKTEQDIELLRSLFEKHNPLKRSKADLYRKIAADFHDNGIEIGEKAIENYLVREKLLPPPAHRSKEDS